MLVFLVIEAVLLVEIAKLMEYDVVEVLNWNNNALQWKFIGQDVVVKRLDVLATAIYKKMTISEFAELDLSYSPLYSPVWDPLLIAATKAIKEVWLLGYRQLPKGAERRCTTPLSRQIHDTNQTCV